MSNWNFIEVEPWNGVREIIIMKPNQTCRVKPMSWLLLKWYMTENWPQICREWSILCLLRRKPMLPIIMFCDLLFKCFALQVYWSFTATNQSTVYDSFSLLSMLSNLLKDIWLSLSDKMLQTLFILKLFWRSFIAIVCTLGEASVLEAWALDMSKWCQEKIPKHQSHKVQRRARSKHCWCEKICSLK